MDQIKIGKFIAQMRKDQGLTQRQLAELLSISDKTVSKWECGKGLPEASLMLPLCDALHMTVNDLLTGEKVSPSEYQKNGKHDGTAKRKRGKQKTDGAVGNLRSDYHYCGVCSGGNRRFSSPAHAGTDCAADTGCGNGGGGHLGRRYVGSKGRILRVSTLQSPFCPYHGAVRQGLPYPDPAQIDLPGMRENWDVPSPNRAVIYFILPEASPAACTFLVKYGIMRPRELTNCKKSFYDAVVIARIYERIIVP